MNEIAFTNTRFDPDLVAFHGIAKEMAKSSKCRRERDYKAITSLVIHYRACTLVTSLVMLLCARDARMSMLHRINYDVAPSLLRGREAR